MEQTVVQSTIRPKLHYTWIGCGLVGQQVIQQAVVHLDM